MNEVALLTADGEVPEERGRWKFRRKTGYRRKPLPSTWYTDLHTNTMRANRDVEWGPGVRWPYKEIVGFQMFIGPLVIDATLDHGPVGPLGVNDTVRLHCHIDLKP